MNDWQLLEEYARTGSETAFAQLVERYLGLVHTVARRQLQDDALAADVAQAVFLLLARKADSLGRQVVLSGWLFRTTRFVAARAQRAEIRRQRREQEAHAMHELHSENPHWSRLAPELDEAIASLSEPDRNALLLRFAEGRNHREIGTALGLTEVAARQRVNRALEKLRGVLGGRGVTITVAVLAGLLTDRLVAAPPVGLAAVISRDIASGVAQTGLGPSLAREVATAWKWTQIKQAMAFLGALVILGTLVVWPRNSAGRFAFEPVRAPHTVVAVSAIGFGRAPAHRGATLEVLLQPFGAIEGVVRRDGQFVAGQTVYLMDPSYDFYSGAVSLDPQTFQVRSDAEGRFRLVGIPPGEFRLYLAQGTDKPFTDETPVAVRAGQTTSVILGEPDPAGRTVVGRIKTSETGLVSDWRRHLTAQNFGRKRVKVVPPAGLSEEAGKLWLVRWHQSEEGVAVDRQLTSYDVVPTSADTFMIRGVGAGDYQLMLTASSEQRVQNGPGQDRGAQWSGHVIQAVTIPEVDSSEGNAVVDLGEIEMKIQRMEAK